MRVATYNILNGGCGREDTLARVVETIQPDVLGLQEVVSPEFVLSLAERLGFSSVMSQVSGRTNVALLSRFPILRSASYQPLPFSKPVLEVELQVPPDQTLTVFVLHLRVDPELPFERRRLREILAALEIARSRRDRPILLMGDLNALEPGAPIRVEPMLKLAQSVAARRHTRTSA
ncbi:MAG TPA: endonuclease/exonuclease/phosphatase family protein [Armatimonadota bacterium]|nr:endonuclease/exonuclease/phosphatase family protein [Armatimonadota bacterium]